MAPETNCRPFPLPTATRQHPLCHRRVGPWQQSQPERLPAPHHTVPSVPRTQGHLKNLGICVAASSYSHISNAYLVSGHNAFPDDAFRTARNPTLLDYAKKWATRRSTLTSMKLSLSAHESGREGSREILGPVDDRAVVQGVPHRS